MFDNYLSFHLDKEPSRPIDRANFKKELAVNYGPYIEDKELRILEIGPGHGELIELLLELGLHHIHAVDVSKEAVDLCNSILENSTFLTDDTITFIKTSSTHYDRIFILHVLEHIPKIQIVPLLSAAHNVLADQGIMIIEVPNMANPLVGQYFRYADFTHEVGFTESSLEYALGLAGFKNVRIFPFLDRLSVVQRITQFFFAALLRFIYRSYKRHVSIFTPSIFAIAQNELCQIRS